MITADPGARSAFIAAWLEKTLVKPCFDVGAEITTVFKKHHFDYNNTHAKVFNGKKIRVRPDLVNLNVHLYLSFQKDVKAKIKDFSYSEYSFESYEKMYQSAKVWFDHDAQVDISLYDKIINFSDTYNTNTMIDLYCWYNNKPPSLSQINILESTNQENTPVIPANHSCEIAAMVFSTEKNNNFKEIDRYWVAADEYAHPDTASLSDRIRNKIIMENYGHSDLHGIGFNLNHEKIYDI
jgi:hypothetical protein